MNFCENLGMKMIFYPKEKKLKISECLQHSHPQSSYYSILQFQKLLYQLYHTILQYTQHPNFYFPIQLIKIIYTTQ